MSDTLFPTGDYDRGLRCAVCSSEEHATAECWAGQAPTLALDVTFDEHEFSVYTGWAR